MLFSNLSPKEKAICPWVTINSSNAVCYLINIQPHVNVMTKNQLVKIQDEDDYAMDGLSSLPAFC